MTLNPEPPAWEASRRACVSAWRASNTALDTVFYDVGCLSAPERSWLSSYDSPEGSILVVYPSAAGQPIRSLTPCEFVDEQMADGGEAVSTVVVAGVGSSAVGTAALARNVADHLGLPVAGIVSGLGMSDVLSEALGGWLVLGTRNALRDTFARLFDAWELKDHVRDPQTHSAVKKRLAAGGIDLDRFIYGSPDSTTLLFLLAKLGGRLRLLVGHSKGNYSIENALGGWLSLRAKAATDMRYDLSIVTLGAVIWFPREFSGVHQFIGRIDYFGMLNSRAFIQCTGVPGAWHSLNAAWSGHLAVKEVLKMVKLTSEGGAGVPARSSPRAKAAHARSTRKARKVSPLR